MKQVSIFFIIVISAVTADYLK